MAPKLIHRLALVLLGAWLAALALPAAAKTMFYVPDGYGTTGSWYLVTNTDGKGRLVGQVGSRSGTYTDNGTEVLMTLGKPFSISFFSSTLDCNGWQYEQRRDVKQVLFRRVDGTNVNKGKTRVVEIGEIVDIGGCTPGAKTPFGSVSDEGYLMAHRSSANREPMTDVVAGLRMAGFREPPRDFVANPYDNPDADIVTLDTNTTAHFERSGHVVNAALSSDQWLVLDLSGFQRAYTRFSINTGNGIEIWLEAEWQDGKPKAVTNVLMTKPLPGASFGTKAATSRMWESFVGLGGNNPFFFYLYRDFTGDRVEKDLVAATEILTPITWRFAGQDVITSRMVGGGTTLSERRWTPLGRTGKTMTVMEQEIRTPSGGSPFQYIPPRLVFYVDRGAAYPPAP